MGAILAVASRALASLLGSGGLLAIELIAETKSRFPSS